ncbi:MAG: TonB-dependent receptor [Gammaproteobacteria bacterium]|nr:TonB-dependent receptor [Gammaproteobacteria bacterium]
MLQTTVNRSAKLLKLSLIAFLLSPVTLVFAQGSALEEVIVTAQKREQSIQDVGIAITAFSGEQLDALGITDSTAIAEFTPGVHISGNNAGYTQQYTIRGATQNDFNDLAEAPNAVYVDEAYQAAGQAQLFSQFDMERVEILKGPQGTLFGRNATGGLVHYVTKKPTDEFEGYGDIQYGRYDTVRFEGAVSGALTEGIKARISGFYRSHDPILKNVFTPDDLPETPAFLASQGRGPLNGSLDGQADLWSEDSHAIRSQVVLEPSDTVQIEIKGQYAKRVTSSGPYQNVATISEVDAKGRVVNTLYSNEQTNPQSCEQLVVGTTDCYGNPFFAGSPLDLDFDPFRPAPDTDFFGYKDRDGIEGLTTSTDHALSDYDTYEIWSVTGKVSIDLNFATLVAVLNYSDQDKDTSLDVDAGAGPQLIVTGDSVIDWYTQELRLEGEEDRYRWIFGTYLMSIDGEFSQNLSDTIGGINVFGASPPPNGAGVAHLYLDGSFDAFLKTKSFSLFGQVDYDLTDRLMFSLGARGIWEKKDYEFYSNLFINTRDATVEGLRSGDTPVAPFFPNHEETTDDFLWSGRVGLQYAHNDDLMLYANFNRGVKAGSCNSPLLTFLTPAEYCYDEEILLAYEVGFKSTLMDGRARVNGSFYYYDYSDYQVFQFIGTSGAVYNSDAEYYGGEVEIYANPIDNLDLILGIGYIDPTVKDVGIAASFEPDGSISRVIRDVEPSFTPEVQFNALGRYTWPLTVGGSVALQVDGNYASSAFHNINNFDTHYMPSYWRGNASLSWYSADERIEVTGFIDNFSDTRNVNIGFELAAVCGCDEQSVGFPRTYGIKLRYNYF